MGDARLRDAERRWREGGRLEDRLRWWSARARAGDLPPGAEGLVVAVSEGRLEAARVELAAYLGDPAAQALALEEVVERVAHGGVEPVLRVVTGESELRVDEVLAWIDALRLWDRACVERALVAATRQLARGREAQDLSATEDEYEPLLAIQREADRERELAATRQALEVVERCLEQRAGATLGDVTHGAVPVWMHVSPLVVAAMTVARFVRARVAPDPREPTGACEDALLAWRDTVRRSLPDARVLRDGVRDALVPWALGGC